MKTQHADITETLLKRVVETPFKGPISRNSEWLIRDNAVRGFVARVYPKATLPHAVSFGVQRKMTVRKQAGGALASAPIKRKIGTWPEVSVKDARSQAKQMLGMMEAGDDPLHIEAKKRAATAAAHEAATLTFGVVFTRFQEQSTGVTASTQADRAKVVKWMKKSPLWRLGVGKGLTVEQVEATFVPLFDAAQHHRPKPSWYGGEKLGLDTAHKIYRYCAAAWSHYLIRTEGAAPQRSAGVFGAMKKARNWPQPNKRTTHLDTQQDTAATWVQGLLAMRDHTDPVKQVFADYLWCLLVWGGRRRETQLLTPDYLNLAEGWGCFKAENTKAKKAHYFPLTPFTAALLKQRLERNAAWGKRTDWVFPSRQFGKPIADARSAFQALEEETGIALTPHALRRTVATETAQVTQFNSSVVSSTLSHAQAGATPAYIQQQVMLLRPSFLAREQKLLDLAGLSEPTLATPNTDALMKLFNEKLAGGMSPGELEKKAAALLAILE